MRVHSLQATDDARTQIWKRTRHVTKGREDFLMRLAAPRRRWQAYVRIVTSAMLKK